MAKKKSSPPLDPVESVEDAIKHLEESIDSVLRSDVEPTAKLRFGGKANMALDAMRQAIRELRKR